MVGGLEAVTACGLPCHAADVPEQLRVAVLAAGWDVPGPAPARRVAAYGLTVGG